VPRTEYPAAHHGAIQDNTNSPVNTKIGREQADHNTYPISLALAARTLAEMAGKKMEVGKSVLQVCEKVDGKT